MFKLLSLLLSLCLYSCASVSADWTSWTMSDVPSEERAWRWCSEELDGPVLAGKGWCWQAEECRTKRSILGNDKKECRDLTLHCAHGDVQCFLKYGYNNMTIRK